jgi:hypothetical protein
MRPTTFGPPAACPNGDDPQSLADQTRVDRNEADPTRVDRNEADQSEADPRAWRTAADPIPACLPASSTGGARRTCARWERCSAADPTGACHRASTSAASHPASTSGAYPPACQIAASPRASQIAASPRAWSNGASPPTCRYGACHVPAAFAPVPRSRLILPDPCSRLHAETTKGHPRVALCRKNVRRRPTLPPSHPSSTIGAERLSFRVRNGTGRFPLAMAAETLLRFQQKPSTRIMCALGSRPNLGNRTVDASY